MNFNTVKFVVDRHLCTCCGTCGGVCPQKAIEMKINKSGMFVPVIDTGKCISCGMCVKACPGFEFDYGYFHHRINKGVPDNIALGHCIDTYSGYAKDEEILQLSQSGGFISTFLINGLKEKLFDGAVVTHCRKNDPFIPSTHIACNRSEVLEAAGSKYNPVPVNIVIPELLRSKGVFAFVGTPCQIQGMRKAEELIPELKAKIAIYLGLHCLKVFNYHYHDYLLYKVRLRREDIVSFRLRDKSWRGWPCDMRMISENGRITNLDGAVSRLSARSYFSNWRCQLCFDKFNEFSDISCGDCRISAQYGEQKLEDVYYRYPGQSDIVIRTERGKSLFQRIVHKGNFVLKESNKEELVKAVKIAEKKLGLNTFFYFTKIFGLDFPRYGVRFKRARINYNLWDILLEPYSVLVSGHYYLCHILIKHKFLRNMLKIIPHNLLGNLERIRERYVYHVRHGQENMLKLSIKK